MYFGDKNAIEKFGVLCLWRILPRHIWEWVTKFISTDPRVFAFSKFVMAV